MAKRLPFFPFFPPDWFKDTRVLTLAAKGAWIDILATLWVSPTRGKRTLSIDAWARAISATPEQTKLVIQELGDTQTAVICHDLSGNVTITNRRMLREETERISARNRKRNQRLRDQEPEGNDGQESDCPANVTPYIPYSIFQKSTSPPLSPPRTEPAATPFQQALGEIEQELQPSAPPVEDQGQVDPADPADPLADPADRAAYESALAALDSWSCKSEPLGRGHGLVAMHNENAAVLRLFVQAAGFTVSDAGNQVPGQRALAKAIAQCEREGVEFRVVSWACGCARNRLADWANGRPPVTETKPNGPVAAVARGRTQFVREDR